ncbi:unnamed protein product [Ectocarpus sp. 6 AP-2014]
MASQLAQSRPGQTMLFANMKAASQFRPAEEFAGKPAFHVRRNGEQPPPLRETNLLPESVSPSRWGRLELRRVSSLFLVAVAVALLTLGMMERDRATLSQNSTHGGRRTTGVQQARRKFLSVSSSDSPDVAFHHSATVFNSSPAVVHKTHVSDVFRLVFVAGLEGTGHHYWRDTTRCLFEGNRHLPRRDIPRNDAMKYFATVTMGGEAETFTTTGHKAKENMRKLAEWAATLSSPGSLQFLPIISYPANGGPLKVMQYADLRIIAEHAESEGVDLRVLYLRRSAQGMVIANTVHRKFHLDLGHDEGTRSVDELFVEYMRVLFTDIAVLQSFLSEVGPGFIMCHDWDRLGGKEQASTLANFISPNDEIAGLVESSLVETARTSSSADTLPFDGADALVSRLQRKLDSFEPLYCS